MELQTTTTVTFPSTFAVPGAAGPARSDPAGVSPEAEAGPGSAPRLGDPGPATAGGSRRPPFCPSDGWGRQGPQQEGHRRGAGRKRKAFTTSFDDK